MYYVFPSVCPLNTFCIPDVCDRIHLYIVKQPYIWAVSVYCTKGDCIKILDLGPANDDDEKTSKANVCHINK